MPIPNPTIVTGNNISIQTTITDQYSNPIDLTGSSVEMKMLDPTGIHIVIPSTVSTTNTGVVTTNIVPANLVNPGLYVYQYVITFVNGNVSTTAQASFQASSPLF